MKKTAIAIALSGLITTTMIQAASFQDHSWYIGGRFNQFKYQNDNIDESYQYIDSLIDKDFLNTKSLFYGYKINPYIGFEMGYDWLANHISYGDNNNKIQKMHGIQATTKLSYPIIKNLDIYTRLGAMLWKVNNNSLNTYDKKYTTSSSPVVASGLEWRINKNISTNLEYQWINNIIRNNSDRFDHNDNLFGIGFSYHFGSQKILPVSILNSKIQPKHFTLKSNILFDFDKSILKPEAKKTLNQLYDKLISLNPKDTSVIVLGFTDRIGTDFYNQMLSEKRAQSIVEYLISKGVPKNIISARGLNKINSITMDNCNNIEDRTKLIQCLAADRRVEIEIKGIKKHHF